MKMKKVIPLIILSSAVLLTACSEKDPKEVINVKAMERWDALKAKDINKAYTYLSPSMRELTTANVYEKTKGGAVDYEDIQIREISCPGENPEVCNVKVYIAGVFRAKNTPISTVVNEKWVKEDGDWWFYDK